MELVIIIQMKKKKKLDFSVKLEKRWIWFFFLSLLIFRENDLQYNLKKETNFSVKLDKRWLFYSSFSNISWKQLKLQQFDLFLTTYWHQFHGILAKAIITYFPCDFLIYLKGNYVPNCFSKEFFRNLYSLFKSWFHEIFITTKSHIEEFKVQFGYLKIFTPQFFCKNSVKFTFSLKNYTVSQFDEKIF